jgi:hypothetical protein
MLGLNLKGLSIEIKHYYNKKKTKIFKIKLYLYDTEMFQN